MTEGFKTAFKVSKDLWPIQAPVTRWCRNNYIFAALEALSTVPW